MKKLTLLIFSIIIIFFIYGIYDGYIEKKLNGSEENIYTFIQFEDNIFPSQAFSMKQEEIERILPYKKELDTLGDDKFITKHGESLHTQLIERYKLYQYKLKLQQAHIKKRKVCDSCLIGIVSPTTDSFIEPKRILMERKNLVKRSIYLDGEIQTALMEEHEDGTVTLAGEGIYKAINIEFKKINNFLIKKLKVRVGNMESYEPFRWKNWKEYDCQLMQAYESVSFCEVPLPIKYNPNGITAFQFVEIKGLNSPPIRIISLIVGPMINIGEKISYLFSRT